MNATLLRGLVALVPACLLLSGSIVLFSKGKTVGSFLQLLGVGSLMVAALLEPPIHPGKQVQSLGDMNEYRWPLHRSLECCSGADTVSRRILVSRAYKTTRLVISAWLKRMPVTARLPRAEAKYPRELAAPARFFITPVSAPAGMCALRTCFRSARDLVPRPMGQSSQHWGLLAPAPQRNSVLVFSHELLLAATAVPEGANLTGQLA
jgi:hypothetical protein